MDSIRGNAIDLLRLAMTLAICAFAATSASAQATISELPAIVSDAATATYVIRPGDALYELAKRHATTVETLMRLNGIQRRESIFVGQRIQLPLRPDAPIKADFGYGIAAFADEDNAEWIAEQALALGVDWVKLDAVWAEIEPKQGQYDFAALDATIDALHAIGIRILLQVYAAPDWSRAEYIQDLSAQLRETSGPPQDMADFAGFMRVLASRYAGLVAAYEIWKAPNLLKYWNVPRYATAPVIKSDRLPDAIDIGAAYYAPLLEAAYRAIKSADATALVITAGLAPVGFSDNYNAVATGAFLHNLLHAGALEFSDAIGAVFSASAVPPWRYCCEKPPGVETHYEFGLQYFRETLYLYRDLLADHGLDAPIIITQAGFGTSAGDNLALASRGVEWLRYTDEGEQARYKAGSFDLARRMDGISGMFLYNLNGCAVGEREACFFSLIDAGGRQRPAFAAIRDLLHQAGA